MLDGVTARELDTLRVCLELPALAGAGVQPLSGMSESDQAIAIGRSLGELADRGYVQRLDDERFAIRPGISQLLQAAAWPATVVRLVAYATSEPQAVVFAYGIHDLAVVHEVSPEGSHRLMPKPTAEVRAEIEDLLVSQVTDPVSTVEAVTVSRGEFLASSVPDDDEVGADAVALEAAREAARSGTGARIDVAQAGRPGDRDPYFEVLGDSESTRWLLSGIGLADTDLITCRPATEAHVRGAFAAILRGTAFESQ